MSRQSVFFLVLLCLSVTLFAGNTSNDSADHSVVGTVRSVDLANHSVLIRIGDATETFTFNNQTLVTYGDKNADASHLRRGDQVVVKAQKNKAKVINASAKVTGTIENIDQAANTITISVGDKTKTIPFDLVVLVNHDTGEPAKISDLSTGDHVNVSINLAAEAANKQGSDH